MKILWLGPVVKPSVAVGCSAVSIAANKWQLGLISALGGLTQEVSIVSHLPERAWPRGKMVSAGANVGKVEGQVLLGCTYLNLPYVRVASKAVSLTATVFRNVLLGTGKPHVVLTYNMTPETAVLVSLVKRLLSVPCIQIVADIPFSGPFQAWYKRQMKVADGCVFLPWGAFENAVCCKLHLDGGIDGVTEKERGTRRTFLYSGSLSKYTGIDILLEAFRLIREKDVELWICGKGDDREIKRACLLDPRISYFGAVSEDRIEQLYQQTAVFVNPRPTKLAESDGNFPSKLLVYLKYLKPVVSTWTNGLAPNYRDILSVPEEDSPQSLANCMMTAMQYKEEDLVAWRERTRKFLLGEKTWSAQAERLVDWIQRDIL